MATAAALTQGKKDWLVILPDNEGVLETRMKVRPQHFDELPPKIESGFLKAGGALLEQPEKEGEGLKIEGSFMLARADSLEEVIEQLKNDIYTKSGVWDMDKTKIYPIKTAFIKP